MGLIEKIVSLDKDKRQKLLEKIETEGDKYGIYPLTYDQFLLWCGYQTNLNKTHFTNPGLVVKMKNITGEKVQETVKKLLTLHDELKFHYIEIDGHVFQYISDDDNYIFIEKDISVVREDKREEAVMECYHELYTTPFDIVNNYPIMFESIKLSEDEFILVIFVHHIIADGFSLGIIDKDIHDILAGTEKKSEYNFGIIAKAENSPEGLKEAEDNVEYWVKEIEDIDKFADVATDFDRMSDRDDNALNVMVEMGEDIYNKVKSKMVETRSNFYNVMSSCFSLVLQAWAEKENVIVGTTLFNREDEKLSRIIGDCAAIIPYTFRNPGECTLNQYIIQNKKNLKKAMDHGKVVITKVQERFPFDRTENAYPLYQVVFAYHNLNILNANENINGIEISTRDFFDEKRQTHYSFDMCFEVLDFGGRCTFRVHYCNRILKSESVENIAAVFLNILKKLDELGDVKLKDIVLKGDRDFDSVETDYDFCLVKEYENAVEKTYKTSGSEIALINRYGKPVPVNFYGMILKKENGKWYETGKSGRVTLDGTLEINNKKSYLVPFNKENVNLKEAEEKLREKYPSVSGVHFEWINENTLILNYSGADLNVFEVKQVCGFAPSLVYKTDRYKQANMQKHQQRITEAVKRLEDDGYHAFALQKEDTDSFDILFSGEEAAKNDYIQRLAADIKDDGIEFCYSSIYPESELLKDTDFLSQIYIYPGRKKSITEEKLTEIWEEILGSRDFGIYDRFYEVGGNSLKVLMLRKRISEEFEKDIKITDLFIYNTISEQGTMIDGETKEDTEIDTMYF